MGFSLCEDSQNPNKKQLFSDFDFEKKKTVFT